MFVFLTRRFLVCGFLVRGPALRGEDDDNFRTLRLHLSPELCDTVEQGWEEQARPGGRA